MLITVKTTSNGTREYVVDVFEEEFSCSKEFLEQVDPGLIWWISDDIIKIFVQNGEANYLHTVTEADTGILHFARRDIIRFEEVPVPELS